MRPLAFFAFALVAPFFFARVADACSFAPQPVHEVDPTERAKDKVAPGRVETVDVTIRRGRGPREDGSSSSCDDLGIITLVPTPPSDDRTAPGELGYRIRHASGDLPSGLSLPKDDVRTLGDDPAAIHMIWIDGATDDQEPIDFWITLAAIDRGGNIGKKSEPIHIYDAGSSASAPPSSPAPSSPEPSPGASPQPAPSPEPSSSSGCRTASGTEAGSFALVLLALTWFGHRTRRRS